MRYLNRMAWAAVLIGVSASSGLAQQGSIISGGGQSLGGLTGTGGLAGGLGGGGGGGGAGGGTGGTDLGGTSLQGLEAAPNITAPTGTGGSSVLNSSNFLSGYYANPYYQGILANAKSNAAPGGFGTALYGTGGGGGGGQIGFAGAATGTTGGRMGTGALGGTALGGRTGFGNTNTNYGVVVPLAVQITYPAVAEFPTAPVATPQLQSDLTAMIARSAGAIANPAGVQVITVEGNNVVIRGTVASEREARLVEGMVRLTPGVGMIKNELTFPAPPRRP